MAYYKEWKSLLGGGILMIILAMLMFVMFLQVGSGVTGTGANLSMGEIGVLLLILGIVMAVAGWMLRNKPSQ